LKRELWESCFRTAEELLACVRELLDEIAPDISVGVFRDWIAWCESVIAGDADNFE
jgi:hypothetical protein